MVMQAGFCCLESGLVRSKNSINVALKNVIDFCIAGIAFWLVGYAIMFGGSYHGLSGTTDFFFEGGGGAWTPAFFLFQLVFCGTATTIISGAVAERMRFTGYIVVTIIVSALIYPIFGHWAWGGTGGSSGLDGWLRGMGFIDFAGSTVVHSTGGWMALAAAVILGPRIGRFGNHTHRIYGHNLPMASLGVLLLWFGWFGFNGGSMYEVNNEIPGVLVKTVLAGAAGGVSAMALSAMLLRQTRIELVLNGVVAGLVGITAGCHVISIPGSIVVGIVAAMVCLGATLALEKLKIDDVVGAIPAHACAGAWGTLAVALLGNPDLWGTGYSRLEQLMVQATGVMACFAWSFGVGFSALWVINRIVPLRIDSKDEEIGLNVSEHGAYNPTSDLIDEMMRHQQEGEFSRPVKVEPHTDVTEIAAEYNKVLNRVNHEIQAREEVSQTLRDKNKDLKLLQVIAAVANVTAELEKVLAVILEEICAHTDWPVGHVYMCDEKVPGLLRSTKLWYLRHPQQFRIFKDISEETDFKIGIGLPGRVLASGKPAWIIDVTQDANFPRAKLAKEIGVRAGFAFPVLIGTEVVAVLEFFSNETIQPNEPLLEMMANVGTQLGRVIERKRAEDQLRITAEHDLLTGLANRQLFNQHVNEAITRAQDDPEHKYAVVFLDVDRFKVVNDSLGHEVGDHLLVSISERIRDMLSQIKDSDKLKGSGIAGRLGGDEFVILLQGIDPKQLDDIAQLIHETLSKPHHVAGREVNMSASIGIASGKEGYKDSAELLRDADLAMYHAKASGRARHTVFNRQMYDTLVERLNMEMDLREALDRKQFELKYQPIVDLESGSLLGFEALLRWNHPRWGMVPPDRFIPIAEETGLIIPIGRWVLETGIKQLKLWQDEFANLGRLSMNINLSKNQLIQPNIVEEVKGVIEKYGVEPETVKLEITESMIMDNSETVTPVLHQLRELGTKLAMDDFGTGHSSLSNLYQFPIDVLKIDRAFISAIDENRGYTAIVFAIVTLAHNLGMTVVAEGIERSEQIAQLQTLECDYGQGYVFAAALAVEDAQKMLRTQKPKSRSA